MSEKEVISRQCCHTLSMVAMSMALVVVII